MPAGGETKEEQNRREGRGRLSSIDMLPEDADPEVVWALDRLRDRTMPQTAIFAEFNGRLADRGIAPISKSAWSRYAVRRAIQYRKFDEVRRMSRELVAPLDTGAPDQVTVLVAEMVKLAAFERLEGGESSTKGIMELARALSAAVGAEKTSSEHRKRLEDEVRSRVGKVIDKADAASTSPDAKAVLKRIREDVYGIFDR